MHRHMPMDDFADPPKAGRDLREIRVLVDNYRDASTRAKRSRRKHERIALDGRYHLDGAPPHPVRDTHHDEHHAAVMLADSLMRWFDDGGR